MRNGEFSRHICEITLDPSRVTLVTPNVNPITLASTLLAKLTRRDWVNGGRADYATLHVYHIFPRDQGAEQGCQWK